jgi:hypothetical protein
MDEWESGFGYWILLMLEIIKKTFHRLTGLTRDLTENLRIRDF